MSLEPRRLIASVAGIVRVLLGLAFVVIHPDLIAAPVAPATIPNAPRLRDNVPVFEIHAFDCPNRTKRWLTGVVIEGVPGIVTALHGVVGCESVIARNRSTGDHFNLHLRKADVQRDVAVLSSLDLDARMSSHKLRGASTARIRDVEPRLIVLGHPSNVPTAYQLEVTVDDTRKTLGEVVPPGPSRDALHRRSSPALGIRILSLGGPLQPGHSGAAILDSQGRVVAIGNGGLGKATLIGWAVPVEDLAFIDAQHLWDDFRSLDSNDSERLFAFEQTPVRPAGLRASLSGAVTVAGLERDLHVRLQIPFWVGNRRVAASVVGGMIRDESVKRIETLPGLTPTEYRDSQRYRYADLGLVYHLRALPRGWYDPYLRMEAGTIGSSVSSPRLALTTGIDLALPAKIEGFVEVDFIAARMPFRNRVFNRYGDAEEVEANQWVGRARVTTGLRIRLRAWSLE